LRFRYATSLRAPTRTLRPRTSETSNGRTGSHPEAAWGASRRHRSQIEQRGLYAAIRFALADAFYVMAGVANWSEIRLEHGDSVHYRDGNFVEPLTGESLELGVKSSYFSGALQKIASVFRTAEDADGVDVNTESDGDIPRDVDGSVGRGP
jgi:outer-membrane receptor for ferric coprogen and ferric-rhodotorulic acid